MIKELKLSLIPLELAKPAERGDYIIIDEVGGVYFAKWDRFDGEFIGEDGLPFADVAYWAPKPTPPKELQF